MFNDPRTRLRKLVSGIYTMVRKSVAGTKTYSATIEKVDARDFTVTITDETKEVISLSSSVSLAEAVKLLRGQLTDLDVKIPVLQPSEEPIDPPIPPFTEGFISELQLDSNTLIAGIPINGYALVVDIDDNPLPGKTVSWNVSQAPDGTNLNVLNAVTDIDGKSYIEFFSILATALTSPPKITAEVDSSSVETANIFVQPEFATMVFQNVPDVELVPGETNIYRISTQSQATAMLIRDQYDNPPYDGITGNLPAFAIMQINSTDDNVFYSVGNTGGLATNPVNDIDNSLWIGFVGFLKEMRFHREAGSGPATVTIRPATNANPNANKEDFIIPFA